MLARLSRILVFIAAVQILGGHWMALQSLAWIGMIAKYSHGETLVTALEKTFDGEHPCALCKVVKSERDQEQKSEVAKVIVKIEGVLNSAMEVPQPKMAEWKYPVREMIAAQRSLAPPTPPPLAV